jgi:hypothetical protein
MAPVDQYLMPDRDAEIASAPAQLDAISRRYDPCSRKAWLETAVKGKNGFVCVVGVGGWAHSMANLPLILEP